MAAVLDEHTQFTDSDGKPLVNGNVYFGTVNADPVANPITIYSDRDLTTVLANPQPLDAYGRAENKVWLDGRYSIQVNDSDDVQVYQSLDNGESTTDLGREGLSSVSGADDVVASSSGGITAYVDKQEYIFTAAQVNTGPMTLDIDGVGPKDIIKNGGQAMVSGDVQADDNVTVIYNETNDYFEIHTPPQPTSGYVSVVSAVTITRDDRSNVFECSGAQTCNLSAASSVGNGFTCIIKANGGNASILPDGAETIDGFSQLIVADGTSVEIVCDGSAWYSTLLSSDKISSNSQATDYTVLAQERGDVIIFTADATCNLPAVSSLTTGWYVFIRANGGNVTIDPNGSETIDGLSAYPLPDGTEILIQSDGSNFNVVMVTTNGLVLIEQRDASTASTEDFTDLTSGFEYEVWGRGMTVSDDTADFELLVSTDNGSSFEVTSYRMAAIGYDSQGGNENDADNAATEIRFINNVGNDTNETAEFNLKVVDPGATRQTHVWFTASFKENTGNLVTRTGAGSWDDTTAVDAIRIQTNIGTFSGILYLYARRL